MLYSSNVHWEHNSKQVFSMSDKSVENSEGIESQDNQKLFPKFQLAKEVMIAS